MAWSLSDDRCSTAARGCLILRVENVGSNTLRRTAKTEGFIAKLLLELTHHSDTVV